MVSRLYEKSVFYSDFHAPFEDPWCLKIAEDFNKWFKPSFVFILGDVCDFYQVSKFDKSPDRMDQLQADLDAAVSVLERLRTSAGPRAKLVYFEGNHEQRLRKWLWNHPEVSSLRDLEIQRLLKFDKFNVEFVPALATYTYHGFNIEHGDIVRKHSSYTARGMMEKRGVSGCSGHTHRLGMHYLTNMGGDYVWAENGCMCDRHPEYIRDPNWQNGFSVGYFKKSNNRFTLDQVCIPDGKCVYAGHEFGKRA